ncbi:hypothetical protein BJY04DRAFT_212707 [Aspergillus karnatakaensis]|uniref:uncharacterized protein n=1 Tax=Aspergillus karnatakaensis TaxID=1810916 RepID=UPI003CCD2DF0
MLSKAVAALLVALMVSQASTTPTLNDLARLEATADNADWSLQAFPNGPFLNFTGTVETIYEELLRLNPNYEHEDWPEDLEDMPTFEEDMEITTTDSSVSARQNPTDTLFCNNLRPQGWDNPLGKGAEYLKKLKGKPHLRAGPHVCKKVSCSWDTAIWWCNDNNHAKTLPSFRNIGDGATVIRDRCYRKTSRRISGELHHQDKWSVKVFGDDC